MTIDERLQFLVQSTESLHGTVAEMAERMDRIAENMERERAAERNARVQMQLELNQHRVAAVKAIQAYLDALENGESAA